MLVMFFALLPIRILAPHPKHHAYSASAWVFNVAEMLAKLAASDGVFYFVF